MFPNNSLSDVTLVINEENYEDGEVIIKQHRIPAQKCILTSGSPYFLSKFRNEKPSNEIIIKDVEPEALNLMLKYFYTEKIEFTFDTAISTLFASNKFLVDQLAEKCMKYLEESCFASNVALLIRISRIFDGIYETEILNKKCLSLLELNTDNVFNSEYFLETDYDTIKYILKLDTLNCSELTRFNALVSWSIAECTRKGMRIDQITPTMQRKVMKDAFNSIKMRKMTWNEFNNGPVQSGLLETNELCELISNINDNINPKIDHLIVKKC